MHPISRQLAVTLASGDGMARLVTHGETLYLVTPIGEVWRVLDSNKPDGEPRHAPANDPDVWARIFIGSGPEAPVRLYRFALGESRQIGATRLNHQLNTSTRGH